MLNTETNSSLKTPLVHTIIVTYNGMQWIDKCLKSLQASSIPTHIIVIDNCSTDDTPLFVEQHFPDVELIKSQDNLGFGKGNNIGLRKALLDNADYVFLLNQDAWVESKTIKILVETHKKNTEYGILSPVHFDWEAKKLEYYFTSIIGPKECTDFISDIYNNSQKEIYPISFIHGAAWLISKNALKTVGGFNPLFNHYCEDLDYVNRLKFKGFKVGIVSKAIVMHWGTHKALNDFSQNLYLNYHFSLVEFLNLKYNLTIYYFIFVKNTLDRITSALIFRKWKVLSTQVKLLFKMSFSIKKFAKGRKESLNDNAFLKS
jgi:GT2 family glycosyltransferase